MEPRCDALAFRTRRRAAKGPLTRSLAPLDDCRAIPPN